MEKYIYIFLPKRGADPTKLEGKVDKGTPPESNLVTKNAHFGVKEFATGI